MNQRVTVFNSSKPKILVNYCIFIIVLKETIFLSEHMILSCLFLNAYLLLHNVHFFNSASENSSIKIHHFPEVAKKTIKTY